MRSAPYHHRTRSQQPTRSTQLAIQFKHDTARRHQLPKCYLSTDFLRTTRSTTSVKLSPTTPTAPCELSQISAETQKVLDALKVSTTYKLDISIFDEYKLFPTWLSIPRLTNRVTTLHIDVRLFGHSPLCYGVRGLPRRTWFTRLDLGFEKCLTRFFLHGPQGEPSSYACGPLIIDNLTLDFRSAEDWLSSPPDKITYDDWLGQQGALDREAFASDGLDANTMYKTPPKWFAQCLSSAMFDDCEEEWLDEWDWVFSQVGVVKFLVEGKLIQQFDTAKELAKFGLEAQKRIRKKRKNLGLSLPGPEVEETTEDDTDESEG